jgi:hypothetical protein
MEGQIVRVGAERSLARPRPAAAFLSHEAADGERDALSAYRLVIQ